MPVALPFKSAGGLGGDVPGARHESGGTPPRKEPDVEPPLGIPELVLCSKEGGEGLKSWEEINEGGVEMGYDVVVYPLVEDDKLSRIYVNVDSKVLKDFNSGAKSSEAVEMAERRYISAVYFHTLFLFDTTKSRKYDLRREIGRAHVCTQVTNAHLVC